MINLLPYEHKSEIQAARTNVVLVRYIAILLIAAVVLAGLVIAAYFALNEAKDNAVQKESENAARLAQYQSIKARSDEFRADLTTAKMILDNSVSFSKLIYAIAGSLPSGVVLDDLSLNPATLGTSVTLNASAKTVGDATRLRDALLQKNQLYSNVQLQSLKSSESGSSSEAYPVKVIMSVTINKGAAQ